MKNAVKTLLFAAGIALLAYFKWWYDPTPDIVKVVKGMTPTPTASATPPVAPNLVPLSRLRVLKPLPALPQAQPLPQQPVAIDPNRLIRLRPLNMPDPATVTSLVIAYPQDSRLLAMYERLSRDVRFSAEQRALFSQQQGLGSTGTGFASEPFAGGTLFITNRHVVENGGSFRLKGTDGKTRDAQLLYISLDADVAVLFVRESIPVAYIPDEQAKPRAKVYAVGFPGINGRPSYQETEGIVANVCVRLNDIAMDVDQACWLEHTATIDHGSSGGPVFEQGTNHVLGINTLGIPNRDGIYLAVPGTTLRRVLRETVSTENVRSQNGVSRETPLHRTVLSQDCRYALGALSAPAALDDSRLRASISMAALSELGPDALVLGISPQEWPILLQKQMAPTDAVRLVLMQSWRNVIRSHGGVTDTSVCERPPSLFLRTGTDVIMPLTLADGRDASVTWTFEFGHWKLKGIRLQ